MVRPKKAAGDRKTEYLQLRMTKNERARMQDAALSFNQALSDFIRSAALEKADTLTPKKP